MGAKVKADFEKKLKEEQDARKKAEADVKAAEDARKKAEVEAEIAKKEVIKKT